MKKFLKVLGFTALAAAVIPCKVEKDEETGIRTYQSLLSRLRVGSGQDGEGTSISLDLLDGIVPTALRGTREEADYADDELELDNMETEPVFEVSFKVERDIPAGTAEEAAQRAEEAAEQAEEVADRMEEEAERAREEAERAREEAERAQEEAETERRKVDL